MFAQRRWLLALAFAGVFLAGATAGVFAAAGYVHHRLRALHAGGPKAIQTLAVHWLDAELDLSPEQETQIDQILFDTHHELFRFKSAHNDEIRAIMMPALARMDALLSPQQAEKWRSTRARIVGHVEATLDTQADQ